MKTYAKSSVTATKAKTPPINHGLTNNLVKEKLILDKIGPLIHLRN